MDSTEVVKVNEDKPFNRDLWLNLDSLDVSIKQVFQSNETKLLNIECSTKLQLLQEENSPVASPIDIEYLRKENWYTLVQQSLTTKQLLNETQEAECSLLSDCFGPAQPNLREKKFDSDDTIIQQQPECQLQDQLKVEQQKQLAFETRQQSCAEADNEPPIEDPENVRTKENLPSSSSSLLLPMYEINTTGLGASNSSSNDFLTRTNDSTSVSWIYNDWNSNENENMDKNTEASASECSSLDSNVNSVVTPTTTAITTSIASTFPSSIPTSVVNTTCSTDDILEHYMLYSLDSKIETLMDLLKNHIKVTVLEDINALKHRIMELMERVAQLEYENELLKRYDSQYKNSTNN